MSFFFSPSLRRSRIKDLSKCTRQNAPFGPEGAFGGYLYLWALFFSQDVQHSNPRRQQDEKKIRRERVQRDKSHFQLLYLARYSEAIKSDFFNWSLRSWLQYHMHLLLRSLAISFFFLSLSFVRWVELKKKSWHELRYLRSRRGQVMQQWWLALARERIT
jgi:hypothetical protein